MKELAELAKEIPAAMTECKATLGDLKHLIAAIKTMSNPITFLYHVGTDILVNGV